MANNQLQYLDGHIGGCDRLSFLNASGNQIKGVPSEYARMLALETLSLESNQIAEFPAALCRIKGLSWIDLGRNYIQHIPPDVSRMRALTHLLLRENNIKVADVPSTLPDLDTLHQVLLLYYSRA